MNVLEIGSTIVIVLLSIALHEFGHAKVADLSGDPTPRSMGRVTLNPLAHLDPMGTLMIIMTSLVGFGIGWGRPVIVRPDKMRNPRWDHFWSVAAGPLTNFLIAAVLGLVLRLAVIGRVDIFVLNLLVTAVAINLGLMFFNLIPLGPLDGHWLVGAFLPEKTRLAWYRFNQTVGSILLLVVVLMGQQVGFSLTRLLFGPLNRVVFRFLTGVDY